MKKIFSLLLLCTLHAALCTLSAQSITVTDTLQLAVTSIVDESNPNAQEYEFAILGDANSTGYKIQINYHAASMYGTFTDADFDLEGNGKNYNFIREAKSDIKFWIFKHLDVTVSDSLGATIVDINGLINDWGNWRRVLARAVIPAPAPDDTISLNLGQATVIPMNQLGYEYLRLDAANDTYSLAFGIVGINTLQAGTYYQADLLRPDLVELPNDTIAVGGATLVVTDAANGYYNLALSLLSSDNILYEITMHTGDVVATDTLQVVCQNGLMQNLKEMYGIYQLAGVSPAYQVAIALNPGVIEKSQLSFTNDSVNLAYTRILDVAANEMIYVQSASGRFVPDSSAFLPRMMVYADMLGINGTLYQVSFPVGGSQLPTAVDTTIVECGNGVLRLDYTYGAGYLGLVVGNDDYDVHVVVYNGLSMKGNFGTDMFLYNDDVPGEKAICYLTQYNVGGASSRLSDIAACEMRMDSVGDIVRIELNVVTTSSHMYCFRANLLPTRALTGGEVSYFINNPLKGDDGMMVAFRLDKWNNEQTFALQLQRSDEWSSDGEMTGANGEVWSFVFMQDSVDGIAGTYGYSAGTLMEDQYHMLTEHNTEIWLMPMAGTLSITVGQAVTIPAAVIGTRRDYHTHLYSVQADMVMENGILYHVSGTNFLLCVDYETEQMVELTETVLTALDEVLGEQGLRVQKVLRNGMILLESADHTYNISGQRIK